MTREEQSIQSEPRIFFIRGARVMLDYDLAQVYGVSTGRLNEQVRRNRGRFPEDFMFQMTRSELEFLSLQGGSSGLTRGGRRYLPYAFTEYGAVMLSAVLSTPFAVQASIAVARAFIRLRRALADSAELRQVVAELERRLTGHDEELRQLFRILQRLAEEPVLQTKRIGFEPPPK